MALGCHGGQREAVRAEARRAAALDPVNYVVTYVGGFALQRAGMIDPPIVREKPGAGGPSKAAVADAKTDIVEA